MTHRRHIPDADVIIVGAGIAGLTAAVRLRQKGHHVVVVEAGPEAGGAMRTQMQDGFTMDLGPQTLIDSQPEVSRFLTETGVAAGRLEPDPASRKRFIVKNGIPLALPSSPGTFLSSPVFSWSGKLRLLAEPFVRSTSPDGESVAAFVRRRFGEEFLTWAADPFVSGVHAGDPEALMVAHAFPTMVAAEEKHRSLLRAGQPRHGIYGFAGGMQTLPRRLAAHLVAETGAGSARLFTNTRALRTSWCGPERGLLDVVVRPSGAVGTTRFSAPVVVHADGFRENAPGRNVTARYAPVGVVALGFRRHSVAHPLDGFGMLVPSVERRRILGTLFSSTLFPERAPDGHVLLTTFVAGARHAELADLSAPALVDLVTAELSDLLGAKGAPISSCVHIWRQGIPQYDHTHATMLHAQRAREREAPGLFFTGNACHGISVPHTMSHALHTARRAHDAIMAYAPERQ